MNFFSIFKKRKAEPPNMAPAAILRLTQEYVPEFYRESKHFKDSKAFLEQHEWDEIESWAIPAGDPLQAKQKAEIRHQFLEWLKAEGIKTDLV